MFIVILLMPFLLTGADLTQPQIAYKAIQEKFEYRNLFDTCINHKKIFDDMRDETDVNEYKKYLDDGSTLLKKSFKCFIKRHNNETLNNANFKKLERLAYAYSLISSPDYSVISKLDDASLTFKDALIVALKDEHKKMMTQLSEFSEISEIFYCAIKNMQAHYRLKERNDQDASKDIGKPLSRFCKYAYLMSSCYFEVSNNPNL